MVNWTKVLLRPIGLPVFLISLPFALFFAPVAALGAAFYAASAFWAYQRERTKALPPGTIEAIRRLPYRRRRNAYIALEYVYDFERRLKSLPADIKGRLNVDEYDIGTVAGTVIRLYETERYAVELAKTGAQEAEKTAEAAAARADELLTRLGDFQHKLLALSMTEIETDLALSEKRSSAAIEGIEELRLALSEASEELQSTLALKSPAEPEVKPEEQDKDRAQDETEQTGPEGI